MSSAEFVSREARANIDIDPRFAPEAIRRRIRGIDSVMRDVPRDFPYVGADLLVIGRGDDVTFEHTFRVAELVIPMARHIGVRDRHRLRTLGIAGLTHDRAKVDADLLPYTRKEGPLDPPERRLMNEHPERAYREYLRKDPKHPEIAIIDLFHHKKTDGYPDPAPIDPPKELLPYIDLFNMADQIEAKMGDRKYRDRPVPAAYVLERLFEQFDPTHELGMMYEVAHFGVELYLERYYRLPSAA